MSSNIIKIIIGNSGGRGSPFYLLSRHDERLFLEEPLDSLCSKVREVRHIVVQVGIKEAGLGARLARQS